MICALVVLSLLASDVVVPFEGLPLPVRDAVHKTFGKGAKIEGAEEAHAEGKIVYEVKVKLGGQVVELEIAPDGTVISEERELKIEGLPAAVRKAVAAAVAGKLLRAEQVTEAGAVSYEVVVLKADGARVEVTVAADGRVTTQPATQ